MTAISTVPVEHSDQFKTEMAVYFEFRLAFVDRPNARIFIRDDPRYDGKVLQVCLSEWYWDPPIDLNPEDFDPSDPSYRNGGVRTYTLTPVNAVNSYWRPHPTKATEVVPVVTHKPELLNICCSAPTYIGRAGWQSRAKGFRRYYNHELGIEPRRSPRQ